MASGSGFYKGEKKKQKQGKDKKNISINEPIVLPKIISKKKKEQ